MPPEPPRQVLVRVGALLGRALKSAIHDTEGGYEVLVRARGQCSSMLLFLTARIIDKLFDVMNTRVQMLIGCTDVHQSFKFGYSFHDTIPFF